MPTKNANRTITFRRVTRGDFKRHFALDSPGYYLALAAERAGELSEPVDTLETVVLLNMLYASEFRNAVAEALIPYGKAREYFEKLGTEEAEQLALQTLGR